MTHDITFCEFYLHCVDSETCPKKLSPAVALKVHESKEYISVYLDKPECFKSINNEDNK